MRKYILLAVPALLCFALSPGALAQQPTTQDSAVLVYFDDDGIKPPELRPIDLAPLVSTDCRNESRGIVDLAIVVDSAGRSKNIVQHGWLDDDLDHMAVAIAKLDRFDAGSKNGSPIAVARNLEISLSVCTAKVPGDNGKSSDQVRLKALPVQRLSVPAKRAPEHIVLSSEISGPMTGLNSFRVGGSVSPPLPVITPAPQLTKEERNSAGSVW